MRTFMTKEFARFARREGITDKALCDAVDRAERGRIDADLGSNLIKQRVARSGQGRRGASVRSLYGGPANAASSSTALPRAARRTSRRTNSKTTRTWLRCCWDTTTKPSRWR